MGCCAVCRFCCLIVTFSLPVGDFIGLAWFAGGFWVYFKVVLAWCFGVVLGCSNLMLGLMRLSGVCFAVFVGFH